MESSSSCHQRAVTDLVISCQFLEGGPNDNNWDSSFHLDQLKSLYAARLAMCELNGAGAATPDKCVSILSLKQEDGPESYSTQFHAKTRKQQPAIPAQLESCLHSLESRPQWWTSYSNNRQNAAVMCQAARINVERDELLKHHKKLADITFGLGAALNQSLNDAAAEATKQRSFLNSINDLRLKIIRDMQDADVLARNRFSAFAIDLESQIRRTGAGAKESMRGILSDAGVLSKDILLSIKSIQDLKDSMNVYSEMLKQNSELAAADQERQKANSEITLATRQSLDEIRNQHIAIIDQEFSHLHSSVRSVNELIFSIHQKQVSLDERVESFERAFQQFESQASLLQESLMVQISNQSRFQESFHADLRIAQSLLADVTSSAANLALNVEKSLQRFDKFFNIGGILSSPSGRVWAVVLLCILIVLNPRIFATCLLIFVTVAGVVPGRALNVLRNLERSPLHPVKLESCARFACFVFGLIFGVIFVISLTKKGYISLPATRILFARISNRSERKSLDLA
ncbi:uncharacterized protein CIMG_01320 [Coccidioides immitis RS]|uniref:Nuclear membrane fusion protein Kar5 n=1 Tax=Coccidioides immitis (strain RS) TaxID=246410 RepID=J3KIY5_COCIM|nr:uncharacterized protein CIMG_01320 [Coccidioides immitis RS]EAS35966.3 hypothetical protein CIMG_01320 [Coccidioides immitis RS]